MNEDQVKDLLDSYDKLRELMIRINANLSDVGTTYSNLEKKSNDLEKKLSYIEKKAESVLGQSNPVSAHSVAPSVPKSTSVTLPIQTPSGIKKVQDTKIPLKEYFKEQGLEVIDKRPSGGKLWITGEQTLMRNAIALAKEKYGTINGGFASGRATRQRPGWYTDSEY